MKKRIVTQISSSLDELKNYNFVKYLYVILLCIIFGMVLYWSSIYLSAASLLCTLQLRISVSYAILSFFFVSRNFECTPKIAAIDAPRDINALSKFAWSSSHEFAITRRLQHICACALCFHGMFAARTVVFLARVQCRPVYSCGFTATAWNAWDFALLVIARLAAPSLSASHRMCLFRIHQSERTREREGEREKNRPKLPLKKKK